MSDFCNACGRGTLIEKHGVYVYVWPDCVSTRPTKFADSAWLECDSCGEQVLPASLLKRIEVKRYKLEGLLTPDQIKTIRGERSQIEMARFIGVGDKTYTRWENGLSVQTKAMDTLIRAAALCPALFGEIERSRQEGAKGTPVVYKSTCTFSFCSVTPEGSFVQSPATTVSPVAREKVVYSHLVGTGPVSWTPGHTPRTHREDESGQRELAPAA